MTVASPWDARFGGADFLYGTAPNDFLREHADRLQGPVLSLAEGEGRNAVFLAERGLDVLGVDGSTVGLAKAQRLAAERGVRIRTQAADLAQFEPQAGHYGSVVMIFAHLPPAVRQRLYPQVERALKPGGLLLLEGYAQAQLGRGTGGPPTPDLLMSAEGIRQEWPGLQIEWLQEVEREVHEGRGHTGLGAVVQFIGRKPF